MKNSVVHRYLYGLLKREACGGNIIHISKINPIVKHTNRIPRKYQVEIVKEMVDAGLLKRLDRDNYEIVSCPHVKPLYDSLGDALF